MMPEASMIFIPREVALGKPCVPSSVPLMVRAEEGIGLLIRKSEKQVSMFSRHEHYYHVSNES
jgi:hypothetical protein